MNVTTPTARLTPSLSAPVSAAIHLTPDQVHVQSLQRNTALRLTLNASLLGALRLEENWPCSRPVGERSVAELTRLYEVDARVLRLENQIDRDQRHKRWLEAVWAASVEHEKKKARDEVAEDEKRPVYDWEKLEVRWE